ncbi:lysozyme family protein [Clostridia bacterium UC5.1-1D1]|uniref:lysozyme family protein n=1 Tax=Agathobaculum massiliense TaxID=3014267 RepID=UPI0006C805D2
MAVYRYKAPPVNAASSSTEKSAGGGAARYNDGNTRPDAELQARTIKKKASSGTQQDAKKATAVRKKRIMKHYMIRKIVRRRQDLKEQKKCQEQNGQRADAAAVSKAENVMERGTQEATVHTVRGAGRTGKAAHALYGATRQKAADALDYRAAKKSVRRTVRRYMDANGKVRLRCSYQSIQNANIRRTQIRKRRKYRVAAGQQLRAAPQMRARNRAARMSKDAARPQTLYHPMRINSGLYGAGRRTASMQPGHMSAGLRAAGVPQNTAAVSVSTRRSAGILKNIQYRLRARSAGVKKLKRKQMQKLAKGMQGAAASIKKKGIFKAAGPAISKIASAAKGKIVLIGAAAALVICMIVAPISIMASPLGLLFADEMNSSNVNVVSVGQAYMMAQKAWSEEVLSGETYSRVEYEGSYADSIEVLAVFAVKVTEIDGLDAMTMGPEQCEILQQVYMDMNAYRKWIEVVDDTRILHVQINKLTADEAAAKYHFSNAQKTMLHELLEDYRSELSALLNSAGGKSLSQAVLELRELVEKYAARYGISDHVDTLLAIIQVESGGMLEDVMQSSESLGLPPNSLSKEASVNQGCKYYSELLRRADSLGCDLDSVIQAYNYGGGFLDYVAARGGKYSFELAQAFAEQKSGGVKVTYKNEISIAENGGWRYNYGNMFYVRLVKQYFGGLSSDVQQRIVAIAQDYQNYGITAPAGYCEMWAEQVYRAAGVRINNWCCAGRNRVTNVVSRDSTNIPVGAMVYNDPAVYNSHTSCHCGLNAGHVGIYLGNGRIMSNIGGSAIDTLESWTSYYGFGGWGWGGAVVN